MGGEYFTSVATQHYYFKNCTNNYYPEPEPEPSFLRMLEDVEVTEGMAATFICEVSPSTAQVTWSVDGESLADFDEVDDAGSYRKWADPVTGERRLTFVRATRSDAGCRVTVALGELQSHAELSVEGMRSF